MMRRRQFLGLAAALPVITTFGGWSLFNHAVSAPRFDNALFLPGADGPFAVLAPNEPFTLVAEQGWLPVPGREEIPFLWYRTQMNGHDYQNPILLLRTGDELDVTLDNQLDEGTIIHWHGLHVPGRVDGHPMQTVDPGEQYEYRFKVTNRGGTYWYHTHAHHRTARQAHQGLASFLLVSDDDNEALNEALGLELGTTDLPLVLQDKRFDRLGHLVYQPNPMQRMMGYLGDEVLVNMTPAATHEVERRIHRLRLLNGSTARIYRLALRAEGQAIPFRVIGTDVGLLESPREAREAFLSPGERLEVLVDFAAFAGGDRVELHSLELDPMAGGGMGGGMMGRGMGGGMGRMMGGGMHDGDPLALLEFVVQEGEAVTAEVPERLSRIEPIDVTDAGQRDIRLDMAPMQWRINGETYDPDRVPIEVDANTREVWTIRNADRSMPHPMHIHGFSFQVLSRSGGPDFVRQQAVNDEGLTVTDLGWKDTVLLWPGETVRIAIDFTHHYAGDQLYVFHCHNLEHEDNDMMVNVRVRA
ncbi:multicopper oxidase family protein [Thioalkalivibrio sp. AKL6]|uniref:multicopper oxidase family protein n=1 Tax=Thioalkalivibrio sp. AKL6 TaxID=1158154 RepID=UPI0003746860|nr:multicopper oxidase domain-containing protein [Thioalkalivibrio sp. AKL6]